MNTIAVTVPPRVRPEDAQAVIRSVLDALAAGRHVALVTAPDTLPLALVRDNCEVLSRALAAGDSVVAVAVPPGLNIDHARLACTTTLGQLAGDGGQ